MAVLNYFKNVRQDGGIRLGIELDGDTLFHEFHSGPLEEDPTLDWYLDVRCEAETIPREPERVKKWLLAIIPKIQEGLKGFAERLEAGQDGRSFPVSHLVPGAPPGVSITLICSAVRRIRSADIGVYLTETARTLRAEIRKLPKEVEAW